MVKYYRYGSQVVKNSDFDVDLGVPYAWDALRHPSGIYSSQVYEYGYAKDPNTGKYIHSEDDDVLSEARLKFALPTQDGTVILIWEQEVDEGHQA